MLAFYSYKRTIDSSWEEGLGQESYEKKKKLDQYEQLKSEGCRETTALSVLGIS